MFLISCNNSNLDVLIDFVLIKNKCRCYVLAHCGAGNVGKKKKKKRLMKTVATTSLPAVERLNADRWNAARSCQKFDIKLCWN